MDVLCILTCRACTGSEKRNKVKKKNFPINYVIRNTMSLAYCRFVFMVIAFVVVRISKAVAVSGEANGVITLF